MVFGSVSRGDDADQSDIDVLELSERRRRPYRIGRMNVSVYDEATLKEMAQRGSLFVLHLQKEGQIIRDEDHKLAQCLEAYRSPKSYEPYRDALRAIANLLDTDRTEYDRRWKAYNELVVFLLRSALYAAFAEAGTPVFALRIIQNQLGREDLRDALRLKNAASARFEDFTIGRKLIGEFLQTEVRNPFGSVEALVTNVGSRNPLVLAFGLRLLGRQNFELSYDMLTFPPFG
jgi:hypothetical protein